MPGPVRREFRLSTSAFDSGSGLESIRIAPWTARLYRLCLRTVPETKSFRLCLGELVLFLALRKMTRLFRMPETKKTLRFSFSSLDLPETTKPSKPVVTGLEGVSEYRL